MILRGLIYILLTYLVLMLIVFLLQRKLLYLPDQTLISPELANQSGLQHWPSVEDFRGFISLHSDGEIEGTMIVFHGNAGAAYHRSYYLDSLSRLGYRVILAEYPGYGGRPGDPKEQVLLQDALEIIGIAHRQFAEPVYLWGESLGAGVAAGAVARTTNPVAGVVMFTPWDSLTNVAQSHYWYFPTRQLLLDKYDSVANLAGFDGNVAVVLAGQDEVVPVRYGDQLFQSITARKKSWLFETASHNRMPIDPGQPWWREVTNFISK